jgi:tRNA modification GTPase
VRIALVGPPNVGKSALANALANRPVSVVSPTPGTTRDWVEFSGELQGFPATWLDTAGLRTSVDPLEQAGVERTRAVIRAADAVLVVLEVTTASETGWQPMAVRCTDVPVVAVVANKVDLGEPTAALYQALPEDWRRKVVAVSAIQGRGLEDLCRMIVAELGRSEERLALPAAFTVRQAALLREAATSTDRQAVGAKLLQVIGAKGFKQSSG